MPGGSRGGGVKRPGRPGRDRESQGRHEPLPTRELQRRNHREHKHGQAESGRPDEPSAQHLTAIGGGSRCVGVARVTGVVAVAR